MGVDLARRPGTTIELLRDPGRTVGIARQEDDRRVVLGFGSKVDLRHIRTPER
jgi:hypothetical protein